MRGLASRSSERTERLTELLHRASSRDARAFSRLHALTKSKMRKTALAAGAAAGDIDDILQEAYLKVWRNAARFDGDRASAITWISAIVRNTAIDALRATKLPTSDFDEACLVACQVDPRDDGGFDYERVAPIAIRALERLPEERRKLIALAYIEGESRAALSRRFGIPVGTVKTWLHRTLETVRNDCLAAADTVASTAM